MIDFEVTECSQNMYLFCFMFFLGIALLFWKKNVIKYDGWKKTYQPIFVALVFIYTILSFYNGDFWHYQAFVLGTDDHWTPSEPIYEIIADILGRNYLMFRIVIWGSALFLLLKIFKLYGLDRGQTLYFFFCTYISVFDYARASLAMAIMWLGVSYLIILTRKRPLIASTMGILLILLSFFFHHSMLVTILSCLMLLVPLNKKILLLIICLFPVLVIIAYKAITNYTGVDILGDDSIGRKLAGLDFEAAEMSFLEKIRNLWHFMTFYIPFFIITYTIFLKKKTKQIRIAIRKYYQLYKVVFGVVLIASSMLFVGLENLLMFYRILYISMIPLAVIFCGLHQHGLISRKLYKSVIIFGILYVIFRHSKMLLHWQGPLS